MTQQPVAKPLPPVPTPAPMAAASSAAPAAQSVQAAEWQAASTRLAAAGRYIDVAGALTLLLDVRNAEQQKRLLAFDRQVNLLRPYSALALGTKDGWLSFSFRGDRPSVEQARQDALIGCRVQPDVSCRTVQRGASFDMAGFREVAAGLGQRSVAEVRTRFIASLDAVRPITPPPAPMPTPSPAHSPTPAPATPAAPTPAPTPAPIPVPPPASPVRPASAWPAAVATLQQQRGQQDFANALITLLQADTDNDRQVFIKFDRMMKRLPWKSAVAMGEEGGQLHYGYTGSDINETFAGERALANCNRSAARSCVVVMSNGKFNPEALIALAHKLGARPQSAVREALLRGMRQSLESGR